MSERERKIEKAKERAVERLINSGVEPGKARDRAAELARTVDKQRRERGQ